MYSVSLVLFTIRIHGLRLACCKAMAQVLIYCIPSRYLYCRKFSLYIQHRNTRARIHIATDTVQDTFYAKTKCMKRKNNTMGEREREQKPDERLSSVEKLGLSDAE